MIRQPEFFQTMGIVESKHINLTKKAKNVFLTENPDVLIVSYKDDATAFNGLKKGTIIGKGAITIA